MKKALLIILFLSLVMVCSADKYASYNSLSFGYGNSYGGLGARYQIKNGTIGLHGGVGYFPAPASWADDSILWSAGLKMYPGSKSFYLNIQVGTVGTEASESWSYNGGYEKHQRDLFGVSYMLGQDLLFGYSGKFGFNWGLGYTQLTEESEYFDTEGVFALDLGFIIAF